MKNHTLTKISAVTLILTFGTILTATAAIPQKTTKEVPPKINQLEKKFFSEIEEITNTKPSGKLTPQQLKQLKNLKSNTEKYIAEQNEEREALTANLDAIMFESPGSFGTTNEIAAKIHDLDQKRTAKLTAAIQEIDTIVSGK